MIERDRDGAWTLVNKDRTRITKIGTWEPEEGDKIEGELLEWRYTDTADVVVLSWPVIRKTTAVMLPKGAFRALIYNRGSIDRGTWLSVVCHRLPYVFSVTKIDARSAPVKNDPFNPKLERSSKSRVAWAMDPREAWAAAALLVGIDPEIQRGTVWFIRYLGWKAKLRGEPFDYVVGDQRYDLDEDRWVPVES